MAVAAERIAPLNLAEPRPGAPVIYWMSRDQRCQDNWALLYAQELALALGSPLAVCFCFARDAPRAGADASAFMLAGLVETEQALAAHGIPLLWVEGDPADAVPALLRRCRAGALVTDFDPLRHARAWQRHVADACPDVACREVDAHNIVPCQAASDHAEVAARTLRPRIHRHLPRFLKPIPRLRRHPRPWPVVGSGASGLAAAAAAVRGRRQDTSWAPPGSAAGLRRLRRFLADDLARYADLANDPQADVCSRLSPYLHFGQVAPQRVALEVGKSGTHGAGRDAFLEQVIVRRELADNFCFHVAGYDGPAAAPGWARRTLERHRADPRPVRYDAAALAAGETGDALWNAAQRRLVRTGRLHGYLRMYWAKMLLQWTAGPEEAQALAIEWNDRYALDGRDPNGYVNIAWCVYGLHDRPWPEQPVTGMIRRMTASGCRRKFDVDSYIRDTAALAGGGNPVGLPG